MNNQRIFNGFKMLIFISFLSLLVGCEEQFVEISASSFKTKWDDSINHTAISWWYLGEKDGYYYVLEKWPLKKYGYKINKEHLGILLDRPQELSFNQSDWINLKSKHIDFKVRSEDGHK